MELLLGCGYSREKKVWVHGREAWRDLVTMDMNPHCGADVVGDLRAALPWADNSAEEIHLYDVLEHTVWQGDFAAFFREFQEFWRVLQPGGTLHAIVPAWRSPWAWGDPGHTRVILPETLTFLHQPHYTAECRPGGTNRTDYRACFTGDFDIVQLPPEPDRFAFVLRAVKPSRITTPEAA